MRNFYNAMCVAMVIPLSSLTTCLGLVSVGMFLMSFFAYQTGMKLGSAGLGKKDDGADKE